MLTAELGLACTLGAAQGAPQITFNAAPSFPELNLLKTPDFTAHDGAKIAGWQWLTATPSNFENGWSEVGRTAPGSAWIKTYTGSMSGYWYQYVTVKPGDKLRVWCWVRTAGGQSLLYLTGDVQPPGGQRYMFDERAVLSSIKSSPLAPVWLKREVLRGPDLDAWTAVSHILNIPEGMTTLAVHIGSYFMRGEMWADDFYAGPPQINVQVQVKAAPGGSLRRVQVTTDKNQPLHDSGDLPAGTTSWQQDLTKLDAEAGCWVQATDGAGKVTKSPRFPPQPEN